MIEVRSITNGKDFEEIGTEWNSLLHRCAHENPFLTHEWMYSWWKVFGKKQELFLLLFLDNESNSKRLVGIFPGFISSRGFMPRIQVLHLIGHGAGGACFLDMLIETGKEDVVLPALFRHLNSSSINLIELTNLSEKCGLISFTDNNPKIWEKIQGAPSDVCPSVSLPEDTEEYISSLSYRTRQKYRNTLRKLQQMGLEIEIVDRVEEIPNALDDLITMHNDRRNELGDPSRLDTSFLDLVASQFCNHGWLEIAFLRVEGTRVAGMCQFTYEDCVYAYITGFELSWSKRNVGFMLFFLLIERAIRGKKKRYELLTGNQNYKYRFGAEEKQLQSLRFKKGLKSSLYLFYRNLYFALRDLLPQRVKIIVKKWIYALSHTSAISGKKPELH